MRRHLFLQIYAVFVAVLIAVASVVDPAWSVSRPEPKRVTVIDLATGEAEASIAAVRTALPDWEITARSGDSRSIPCARDERCVVAATVEESVRDRWQERLAARGFRLEGIYPQLGTPLCALEPRLVELPTLALQVEKDSVAVMEVSGGGCRSIEVHARAHPITSFCERLIGIGCAEVLLCGGEDRLPQLGYEIARSSGTWIRLQRERGAEDEPGARPPMAILGGAYHAFGLTPVGAVACVPPAA